MSRPLRVAIVAGEVSGDILGGDLLAELRRRHPDLQVEGIGGELMQQQGMETLYPMERLAVMGLVEVLGRLPELLRVRRRLIRRWRQQPPDLFIGIDAPDFNLGLEKALRASAIPTVHYVSPSVWAWRRGRIHGIRRSTDLMLTLFPFEAAFYQAHQQPVAFVGHPLADQIPLLPDTSAAREALGLFVQRPVLALLPGSRAGEVAQLAPPFLRTARMLYERYPDLQFVLPAANQLRYDSLSALIESEFATLPVKLVLKQSRLAMEASDAILIASGTATLEAMLYKKPMVVAYRMAPLTYRLLSRLVRSRWISLPNLLAQETLVAEVLQDDVCPERLLPELERVLRSGPEREQMVEHFTRLHLQLRQGASEKAATAVEQLLRQRGKMDE